MYINFNSTASLLTIALSSAHPLERCYEQFRVSRAQYDFLRPPSPSRCRFPSSCMVLETFTTNSVSSRPSFRPHNWSHASYPVDKARNYICRLGRTLRYALKNLQLIIVNMIRLLGDTVYIHCLGKKILVLNSLEATRDLLDQRSSIYSNRPRFVLTGEMWPPCL
jgi:hypothetical protein